MAASAFCLVLSVLLIFLNVTSKADNTLIRVFALLIMIIWIPIYVPAFVTLLNLTMPSFSTKEAASELYNTHYDGEGNYSVQIELEETGKILSFRVPKDIYDQVSYDSTSEITIQKGLLGIDYARLRLNHLEAPDSEKN